MPAKRIGGGFTLIELLVVVAIIALLISILLPALGQARERGRAVTCLSNIKQVALAFFLYAEDFGVIPGTYWQGPINLDWSGRMNQRYLDEPERYEHPIHASVLRTYVSTIDKILECPTAQREANALYDYTVIIRMAGAQPDLPWIMTYPENPKFPIKTRRRFPAIPLLIEEDALWYNEKNDDGSWANWDQITDRHDGAANIAYLNGTAGRFVAAKGADPKLEELDYDLNARNLRVWVGRDKFPVWESDATEFGWINRPE
ncbi:MAG: DUF1559 domain-containing protein [Planctomycetes bacterium]|nr:DUF1559 domain-containing protein [Planctomycetota bacterium]